MSRAAPLPESFAGLRVGVVGLAREGVALTRYLASHGAHVVVSDRAEPSALLSSLEAIRDFEVTLDLGGHSVEPMARCDVVFVSPGVPRTIPVLAELQARGVRLSSETELFLARCPVEAIGITGSAGKTTTTTLVGKILEADGRHVLVGGNIGRPLIGALGEIRPDSAVVLELSSFQLQHLETSPHIAAVLNVTPNHLDRHRDMAEYAEAKRQIVAHQEAGDVAVLNTDDPIVRAWDQGLRGRLLSFSMQPLAQSREGAYLDDGELVVRAGGASEPVLPAASLRLRGRHNVANALAAIAVTSAAGASVASMRAVLQSFGGVEHRLEEVHRRDGITYVNDSIATAPERLMAGLRSFDSPVVLLAGGRDKHLPWDDAAALICARARAVVTMGEAAPLIEEAIEGARTSTGSPRVTRAADMQDAVRLASAFARPGDVVLLSPGCTSYDRYRNYEERGDDFKVAVRNIVGSGALQ